MSVAGVFLVLDGILKLHLKIDPFIIGLQNWFSFYNKHI